MEKLNKVLKTFTRAIASLEKIQTDNNIVSDKNSTRVDVLNAEILELDKESQRANSIRAKIEELIA